MKRKRRTYEEYLDEFNKIHNNKYIYKLPFTFKNQHNKIEYYCPIHNVWNNITVYSHLQGCGCSLCAADKDRYMKPKGKDKFVKECYDLYGTELYDYSDFIYKNALTPGLIKCKKCGNYFPQTPSKHLQGHGCHFCNMSFLERMIYKELKDNNIEFIDNYRADFLKNKNSSLSLDFYIEKYNSAIECQGIQHFEENHFFESFDKLNERDKRKLDLCKNNNIKLFYFSNYDKTELFLGEKLYKDSKELIEDIIKNKG